MALVLVLGLVAVLVAVVKSGIYERMGLLHRSGQEWWMGMA